MSDAHSTSQSNAPRIGDRAHAPVGDRVAPVPATWGQGYGRLAGKTALVTGSTRGLGRVMAEWLAREGANIVVSGRDVNDVADSVQAMQQLGVKSWGIPANLAQVEDAHALAAATLATAGPIDLLINNAGMSIRGHFWEVTDAEWEEQMHVNVRSPFILAQHAAAAMIDHEIRGRIVNVSTIGVAAAHRDGMVYNIAKAGVETMTRNMSYELAPYGISVNCVAPGAVPDKPGTVSHNELSPPRYIPFGRYGRAEDIAAAVVFFCLPETEWTTGQTLLIDGAHNSYLCE